VSRFKATGKGAKANNNSGPGVVQGQYTKALQVPAKQLLYVAIMTVDKPKNKSELAVYGYCKFS